MKYLIFNAGSSSLKTAILDSEQRSTLASAAVDWAGQVTHYEFSSPANTFSQTVQWRDPASAVTRALADLRQACPECFTGGDAIAVAGHRVVHGGDFAEATLVTPQIREQLGELVSLAPLHNPPSLAALDQALELLPAARHFVCFDTSFHQTKLAAASRYAVPREWFDRYRIRRYGFHGLSYAYNSRRAAEMLGGNKRLVICHLGHGCSACAVRDGNCVDTTMGFTPLEGLMMATRSGSIDVAAVLYLQRQHGLAPADIDNQLNRQSGLLGVSETSADMRQVLSAARGGDERAGLAVDMYCHRVRQAIGALAVTLGGIDALVFTAGVGEHSAEIRATICQGLECLDLQLDLAANQSCRADRDIATADSAARILVIRTREDLSMLDMLRTF